MPLLPGFSRSDREVDMVGEYVKPSRAEEALKLKNRYGSEAFFLAGGSEVNRLHSSVSGSIAIDISAVTPKRIETSASSLIIGAGISLQQIAEEGSLPDPLRHAAGQAASRPLRHMATAGGNIASDRRDSYLIPVLLAYDALLEMSSGETVSLEQWLSDKQGLIMNIIVPDPKRLLRTARLTRTSQGSPVFVMACAFTEVPEKGVRFVVGGLPGSPRRVKSVETLLASEPEALERLPQHLENAIKPVSDYLGSAEYKRYIAGVSAMDLFTACIAAGDRG